MQDNAIIVLSGGLDSATCLGIALKKGYNVFPITFEYGQRHKREVKQASALVNKYGIKNHKIVNVNFLSEIGNSALTDYSILVPTKGVKEDIPETYVPGRNMIFLALASAYAEILGARYIYTGVNAIDYSGYPDCRTEFIKSMNKSVNLATKVGTSKKNIEIITPLINITKAEIIKIGIDLKVPYELTTSCYSGREKACGYCDSCRIRIAGFKSNSQIDPIAYEIGIDWDSDLNKRLGGTVC
jgi:7-cyano-7-deazaguanine synthase